jgi:hypothetical protein
MVKFNVATNNQAVVWTPIPVTLHKRLAVAAHVLSGFSAVAISVSIPSPATEHCRIQNGYGDLIRYANRNFDQLLVDNCMTKS